MDAHASVLSITLPVWNAQIFRDRPRRLPAIGSVGRSIARHPFRLVHKGLAVEHFLKLDRSRQVDYDGSSWWTGCGLGMVDKRWEGPA